ncbi:DUF6988 family protein [Ramlibacter sp.]|uniref:DUF6988 family protein n=1 Tax=Ramlibacter sp. TaxID=1917967 RepID=UPI002FC82708
MKSLVDPGSVEYLNWLGRAIHECKLPATNRVRAAASCLAIAQDHHHAIVLLVDHHLYASAFALVRVAFEAYVRGEWLAACASEEQVESFVHGDEPPKFRVLLEELEQTEGFKRQVLSSIKAHAWDAMCAYTHTGGLHIQRWNTSHAIEPGYEEAEVREVLDFAETVGSLAVIGVAKLAEDVEAARAVLERFKQRKGQ